MIEARNKSGILRSCGRFVKDWHFSQRCLFIRFDKRAWKCLQCDCFTWETCILLKLFKRFDERNHCISRYISNEKNLNIVAIFDFHLKFCPQLFFFLVYEKTKEERILSRREIETFPSLLLEPNFQLSRNWSKNRLFRSNRLYPLGSLHQRTSRDLVNDIVRSPVPSIRLLASNEWSNCASPPLRWPLCSIVLNRSLSRSIASHYSPPETRYLGQLSSTISPLIWTYRDWTWQLFDVFRSPFQAFLNYW